MRDGSVFSKSMAGFLAALLSAGIMLTGCGSGPAASSGHEETAVENSTVSQGAAAEYTAAETTDEEKTTALLEAKAATSWIYEFIKQICKGDEK